MFRLLALSDLHTLMSLDKMVSNPPWSEQSWRTYLSKPNARVTAVDQAGKITAFIVTQSSGYEIEVLSLGTHPNHRRKGHAKALLNHEMDYAQAQGVETLWLEVRASNVSALCLYEGLGMVETGRRPNYYPSPQGREDAILLALELIAR